MVHGGLAKPAFVPDLFRQKGTSDVPGVIEGLAAGKASFGALVTDMKKAPVLIGRGFAGPYHPAIRAGFPACQPVRLLCPGFRAFVPDGVGGLAFRLPDQLVEKHRAADDERGIQQDAAENDGLCCDRDSTLLIFHTANQQKM